MLKYKFIETGRELRAMDQAETCEALLQGASVDGVAVRVGPVSPFTSEAWVEAVLLATQETLWHRAVVVPGPAGSAESAQRLAEQAVLCAMWVTEWVRPVGKHSMEPVVHRVVSGVWEELNMCAMRLVTSWCSDGGGRGSITPCQKTTSDSDPP